MLSALVRKHIEEKYGHSIRYPKDCDALSAHIRSCCSGRVSPSTLKRLFGFVKGIKEPRLFTLDILANYLNYETWDCMMEKLCRKENAAPKKIEKLNCHQLKKGSQLELSYAPGKKITLRYEGKSVFEVILSEESAVRGGDKIKAKDFVLSHPVYIEIIRHGKSCGLCTIGRVSGLIHIEKLTNK